jgi:N-acetylglucosamine-6-phosphate deacetylase
MPPGRYTFGPEENGTVFESDGTVGFLPDGGLASSVRGLDYMVTTMLAATGISLPELLRMVSLTPAERLGISDSTGSLAPGKRADVLVLSDALEVDRVFIGGQEFV